MKKINVTIISIIAISLSTIFNSCVKPSTANNNNTTNSTVPLAASGTLVINGKTFASNYITAYGKYKEKSYHLGADFSNADSNIFLYISTAEYLPATATINFDNNLMPLAASKASYALVIQNKTTFAYYQETTLAGQSGSLVINKGANDMQYSTNNSQGFKVDATKGSLISFNIKRDNPTIQGANATYTIPTGLSSSVITIGNNVSYTHGLADRRQANNNEKGCQIFVSNDNSSAAKNLTFNFSDGLPVSGTYDIVASKSAIAAGKVYVEYVQSLPLISYQSIGAGTIVVENNNGDVKVYAKDLAMKDIFNNTIGNLNCQVDL